MPARRLPWVKLWPELMEREKVRRLTDGQYRTWSYCLLAGSQQPTRWRFDSLEHAAYVTRRPLKEVQALADARFLDAREDGVWIHDAEEYQDVYPSDVIRDRSANTPPTLPEGSANTRRLVVNHSLETETEIETEKKKEIEREKAPSGAKAPSPPQAGKGRRVTVVDDDFESSLEDEFYEAFGSRQAVRDVIAHAMSHKARAKCTDQRAYLRNWVRDDAQKSAQRRGKRQPAVVDLIAQPVEIRPPRSCKQCGKPCYLNADRCGACRKADAEKGAA